MRITAVTAIISAALWALAGVAPTSAASRAGDAAVRLITACEASKPRTPAHYFAAAGRTFCLDGSLTDDDVAGASALIRVSRNLVLRSPGGVGENYLAVALSAGRIDNMVVRDYCLSACANYLFFLGRSKYVGEGSFIAFHGAPPTDPELQVRYAVAGVLHDRPDLTREQVIAQGLYLPRLDKARAKTADLIRRQDILYRRLGVRPAFTSAVNNLYFSFTASQQPGWAPDARTLRACFGVRGLRQYWRPSDRELSDLAANRYHFRGMVVLAYPTNWVAPCGTAPVPPAAAVEPPTSLH